MIERAGIELSFISEASDENAALISGLPGNACQATKMHLDSGCHRTGTCYNTKVFFMAMNCKLGQ